MPPSSQVDDAFERRERIRVSLISPDEVNVTRTGESMRVRLLPNGDLDPSTVLDATLTDMIIAAIGASRGDDLLCVTRQGSDRTALRYIRQQSTTEWCAEILHVDCIEPDVSWTFTDANSDQSSTLGEAHDALVAWLGQDALLLSDTEAVPVGILTVKVDMRSRWFIRFPLSVFNQLGTGALRRHRGVEWIVTQKTFVEHYLERDQIRRELGDLRSFMSNTVIILNTYHEYDSDVGCSVATETLVEILGLLRNIDLGDANQRFTLRWHLNPSAAEVQSILRDPSTTYFFADFEASTGHWESGEGPCLAWNRTEPEIAARESIAIDPDVDDLSHIRLMRVFHCNSIFDPYIDRAPAHEDTIVSKLLRAGAWRVEGGMTKELYIDYLESLAVLMLKNKAFEFVLRCQALDAKIDLGKRAERLWSALNSHR